jgi:hypothetical protein
MLSIELDKETEDYLVEILGKANYLQKKYPQFDRQ